MSDDKDNTLHLAPEQVIDALMHMTTQEHLNAAESRLNHRIDELKTDVNHCIDEVKADMNRNSIA